MNRHTPDIHDEMEQLESGTPRVAKIQSTKQRRASYSRRGSAPTVFNGIHRRRRKRIKW